MSSVNYTNNSPSTAKFTGLVKEREVLPPCQAACPAGVRARDYIALIAQGYYLDAVNVIRQNMPFPSACGRICQHPCETECNRRLADEPVSIMHLKRFASDYEFKTQAAVEPLPKIQPEEIAVLGAGPCGLTAAQDLTRLGYPVTVFEALPYPGGNLRAALPIYRLPKELLDWDIHNILALGIKLNTNIVLNKNISLTELQDDGYKAILVAIGAERSRRTTEVEKGIFGEGDLLYGTVWTVHAVGAGHKAATLIHSYLKGYPNAEMSKPVVARLEANEVQKRIGERQASPQPRYYMPLWGSGTTELGFTEMELGYDEETALKEASRCLSCGAAEIIKDKCPICLTCLRLCPYDAPAITTGSTVEIRASLCRACGLCVNECPANAIDFTMPGLKDINWHIESALSQLPNTKTKVLVFYCSYRLPSVATYTQFLNTKPDNLAAVLVPCIAKIGVTNFLKAVELGVDVILVGACSEPDCPYQHSMFWLQHRVETAKNILKQLGLSTKVLSMHKMPASDMINFDKTIELIAELKSKT
jgi:coenzyme F420-reducing hydrogenase delta subunit/Pyruvate/2-oxoacid:ferredoxin oxidoreductase delta subunit